jgi:hypothetical protein
MSPLSTVARAFVEGFSDSNADAKRAVYADTLATLVAFVFALFLVAFIGKLLWNGVVVDLFSFAKPAKSWIQVLGLMIFVNLISP